MRRTLMILAGLSCAAVVLLGLLRARGSERQSDLTPLTHSQVSRPIPGVTAVLSDLRREVNALLEGGPPAFDGELRRLRGHPVVVNLWASWCGPCRAELPVFQRAALARARTTAFIGVDVDDNLNDAHRLIASRPLPYPSYEDPVRALFRRFRVVGLPSTVFYDGAGNIVMIHQGSFFSFRELIGVIDRYR